ncbi:MRPL6 [[Candida] subhashii]|uniref:MRPL6 n=1 Tax=[Candida] subhashii TaxID=561895 RepID=A0A8J5QME5_9ASCO|nr:MRPL6 [[Candida] subhashii]KAG7663206.1 MRPL6 [[Candida] subhashii]
MNPRIPSIGLVRFFSTTRPTFSKIGKKPIQLVEGVEFDVHKLPYEFCKKFTRGQDTFIMDRRVIVKGPKGVLKTLVPPFMKFETKDDLLEISVNDPTHKVQRALWGTMRSIIQNNVDGATQGHLTIVKFVGTGYRGLLEKNEKGEDIVSLKVGRPYTPKLKIPEGLTVTSPNPTRLIIEGADKQQVKLFAASIRAHRKPEPYKGKGIFVDDETIKLKEKKVK